MPIDKPEATAATNTRRTFLARAAIGSALVATSGSLLASRPVGAQAPSVPDGLTDDRYLVMAAQLHTAAAIVYVAAAEVGGLSEKVGDALSAFEADHQAIVTDMGQLMNSATSKVATVADPTVLAMRDSLGGDEAAVLQSLATMEDRLAATHLWAIGALDDATTARGASQALATAGQRSTYLGILGDVDPAQLAPATIDDGEAIGAALDAADASIAGEAPPAAEPTEPSGGDTTGDDSGGDDSAPAGNTDDGATDDGATDDSGAADESGDVAADATETDNS